MYAKSLIVTLLIALPAAVPAAADPPDESTLKQTYDAFVESLDHRSLAKDYLGAVRNLDSPDSKIQTVGIKTLAATEEPRAIPWIVPFLDLGDRGVRIHAGQTLNAIVATHQLKRRDQSQPERGVIFPPGPGDIDLRPLSWVILKMLRLPDDGNTVEKTHYDLYSKALATLEAGKDLTPTAIHVCDVCGHTVEGEAPDKCPVCGAPKKRFTEVA